MTIRYQMLALLLVPLSSGVAQQQDTSREPKADSLRARIEERFAARVQEQLGLNNQQTTRLKATSQTFGARRRELRQRERQVREALWNQLQPGVAASGDSVTKLTDAMTELKLRSAQTARDEMKELATFLSPVQRARLYLMREQFHDRVKRAHGHRGTGRRYRDHERHRDHVRSWM
jgi:hypothetical protein